MQLTILGYSPILQSDPCGNCSGYLIDAQVLLDCGPGIWHALCKRKIEIGGLKYIFISHFHLDHTSDLAAILMTKWLDQDKNQARLKIYGPPGLKKWYQLLCRVYGEWLSTYENDLIELTSSHVKCEPYEIRCRPTEHSDNSLCFRVSDSHGVSVFYSGDSDYSQDLISLARNCDLALIEASNTVETKIKGHLTPQLAAKIAAEAGVKRLLLIHMYPEVQRVNVLKLAAAHFSGKIQLARDGLNVTLK